jgi:hypothetical protein
MHDATTNAAAAPAFDADDSTGAVSCGTLVGNSAPNGRALSFGRKINGSGTGREQELGD